MRHSSKKYFFEEKVALIGGFHDQVFIFMEHGRVPTHNEPIAPPKTTGKTCTLYEEKMLKKVNRLE